MKTFTILLGSIAIVSAQETYNPVVLVPELPAGVWDGKCTVRKMQKMHQVCVSALGQNPTEENIFACNLLKPNAFPLGGLDHTVPTVMTVGMFDTSAITFDIFDKCAIPRLIADKAITLEKTGFFNYYTDATGSYNVFSSPADSYTLSDGILDNYSMEHSTERRRISKQPLSEYPAEIIRRYLYRDYILKVNKTVLHNYLSDSTIGMLQSLFSEFELETKDTKQVLQSRTMQGLLDKYFLIPTEFYYDYGIASVVQVAADSQTFRKDWKQKNQTAKQFVDSTTWDQSGRVVAAKDFLYGGCNLDSVSGNVTIEAAIDACYRSSKRQPNELEITSFAKFVSVFDLLKETDIAKQNYVPWVDVEHTSRLGFIFCICDLGWKGSPKLAQCRQEPQGARVDLNQNCTDDKPYQWLRDLDYTVPLPLIFV